MNYYEWKTLRDKYNHDILQNQVIQEVAAYIIWPRERTLSRLSMWINRKNEYLNFIQSASQGLSPAQIVNMVPFNNVTSEKKEVLSSIFVSIFNATSKVEIIKDRAMIYLSDSYSLAEKIFNADNYETRITIASLLQASLENLSRTISSFPNEIGDY